MMSRIVAFGAAGALALGALAGTAAAQNGNAYGAKIKTACENPYGYQVKQINPAGPLNEAHGWTRAVGAPVFYSTIPAVHCGNGNGS
jgi:hypothetical protein